MYFVLRVPRKKEHPKTSISFFCKCKKPSKRNQDSWAWKQIKSTNIPSITIFIIEKEMTEGKHFKLESWTILQCI